MDIRDSQLQRVLQAFRPETVFHLAAQASVPGSITDPSGDASVNVMGTLNLLKSCGGLGVENFVFSSTGGALYGDPDTLPCTESSPIRPRSQYGASKAAAEAYVQCFAGLDGYKWSILRYANVYGPRQDPFGEAGVIAIFAKRIIDGLPVVVYGDGEQKRDFVYVGDVVEANVLAPNSPSGAYNVGSGIGTTVNEIRDLIGQTVGLPVSTELSDPRTGDVVRVWLDPSHASECLGWKASVGLEEGVTRTVKFLLGT